MKAKTPQLLIIIGAVLLVIASSTIVYNLIDDYRAGQRARLLLTELQNSPYPAAAQPPDTNAIIDYDASALDAEDMPEEPEQPLEEAPPQEAVPPPRPSYNTVGVLSIARFKLQLPVISECTDNLLKISVCKYKGEAEEKPQRLVVAGHNYKSHFGRISQLEPGDTVYFTNQDGVRYDYTVTEITEIAANDHYGLEQGEWDIVLFTCTPGGSRRIVVRCLEETQKTD